MDERDYKSMNKELTNPIPQTIKTMNIQQALEVLKRIQEGEQTTQHDFDEALTIAIECMEARKAEIVNAFDYGYASGYDDAQGDGATYEDGVQYYHSLTRPQSDTEITEL